MKKIIRSFIVILFLSLSPFFLTNLLADEPPNPGGGPGGGDLPVGGGSPIGGGIALFVILGTIYGTGKTYFIRKKA
ncbi:MAG: hypothetical protein K8R53_01680 [Bacteroidales bacterium]|nr:hypothetical protein [Bacteroidales bacterium]